MGMVDDSNELGTGMDGPFPGHGEQGGVLTGDGAGMRYRLRVDESDAGVRVDRWLDRQGPLLSRSQIQRWMQAGLVTVGGRPVKASLRLTGGELIEGTVPIPKPVDLEPREYPLEVLYEDEDLLALNKPVGMVVHPGAGNEELTLVHVLLYHCADLRGVGDELRPGIVHRLDRDTSGVLLVAKHDVVHRALVEQFSGREIHKEYRALARGVPSAASGRIEGAIGRHPVDRKRMAIVERGGKPAVTRYQVVRVWDEISEIQCFPETGRTHQIRVHLASLGHPIWGDAVYGGTHPMVGASRVVIPTRQMLHAYQIQFRHPRTGETLAFIAPFPKDWLDVIEGLGKGAL